MKATQEQQRSVVRHDNSTHEYISPYVNIYETSEGYMLEAEMPGVNKEGLEITLEGNEITITGHRRTDSPHGTKLMGERSLMDYRRVFELDPAIDTSKILAKMEQGVLNLMLPKSEQVKPRQIKVE